MSARRSLLLIVLGAATIAAPFDASAATFRYGSVAISADASSTQALLSYHALDARQTELCDLAAVSAATPGTIVCDPNATTTPPGFTAATAANPGRATSPDGRFTATFTPATASHPIRTYRITDNLKGKTYTLTTKVNYWDLLSEEDVLFQFSPDGSYLIYKDDREGPQTLYKVDLAKLVKLKSATFKGTRLWTRGYTVSGFMLADAHTLLYVANRADPLRFDLYAYDLATKTLSMVTSNVSYYPQLKRAANLVIFDRFTTWGSQPVAYDLSSHMLKTFPGPIPGAPLVSLKEGTDITLSNGVHGSLLLPDNFNAKQPHQVVIWLHGGPARQTALGFHPYPSYGVYDWMLEGLRESGVVVLKLDYHGSTDYGRAFAESLKGNVGLKDVNDVLLAASTLKTRYAASQTYLMGVSYGGYLALRSLVERPAAFAGAISVNGVTDWNDLVNKNPSTIFAADFMGPLTVANQAYYDRASIYAKVGQLGSQKVVLLHSTADTEISYSQSSTFADILTKAGKNVQFTPLPGDDHVLLFQKDAMTVCSTAFQTLGIAPGDKCTLDATGTGAATGGATGTAPDVDG